MRVRMNHSLQPKQNEAGSKREESPSRCRLQASPTSARSWKKLLPLMCHTGRQQREEAGGAGTIGFPEQNPADCCVHSTPSSSCPGIPRATMTLRY